MESFRIDMKGVFKIKKNQRKKTGNRINEYGDEKIIREGDFYKPGIAASPFYGGKLERGKVMADNLSAWLESRHLFKREGPIFLSFTRTTAEPTVMELREELERLVQGNIIRFGSVRFSSVYKKNIFSDDATILILSGSHGTKEGEVSTSKSKSFNMKYCRRLSSHRYFSRKESNHLKTECIFLTNCLN